MKQSVVSAPLKNETIKDQRRIIQIAIAPAVDEHDSPTLHALCNDGTVWVRGYDYKTQKSYWHRVSDDIPQS